MADMLALLIVLYTVQLSVVYNDHSFYVWDVTNVKQVGKNRSSLFHSACVWDICVSTLHYLVSAASPSDGGERS